MPDLSLCLDNVKRSCPLASVCYRATAEPDELGQSYVAGNPGVECRYFMPNNLPVKDVKNQTGGR